jgi:murein L,D-transpeptidase YcbB/YkuD
MNVPVQERIKTLMVNMERCRWLPSLTKSEQYGEYTLLYAHLL